MHQELTDHKEVWIYENPRTLIWKSFGSLTILWLKACKIDLREQNFPVPKQYQKKFKRMQIEWNANS